MILTVCMCASAHTNVAPAVKQQHDNTLNPPLGFIYDDVNARKTAHLRINLAATWMQCHEFPLALYANQAWKRANLLARERTRPSYLWRCVFTFFYFIYFNESDSLQWAMKNKRAQFLDDVLLISTWLGRLFNKSRPRRNINQHLFATSLFYIYIYTRLQAATTLFTRAERATAAKASLPRWGAEFFAPAGIGAHRGWCIK